MNSTSVNPSNHRGAGTAIAIIFPTLFAIVLAILIAIALILRHLEPPESTTSQNDRRKERTAQLARTIKAQNFIDWARKQHIEHPQTTIVRNPLCVICLDQIEDAAQIRGLHCRHIFHQQCLDDWFSLNEYCPLCHRLIIQRADAEPQPRPRSAGEGDGRYTSDTAVAVASMV